MNARQCQRCGGEHQPRILDSADYCRLCVMLMAGAPPRIKTEATFQAAAPTGGASIGNRNARDLYLKMANEAGVTTDGRVYEPRMALFPGDPQAWISNQDEMRSTLENRGMNCSGDVTVKSREVEPIKSPGIADDILEDLIETKLEEKLGPDFTEAKGGVVERARDDVLQQFSPPEHVRNA